MYYEETLIDGVLHWRINPDDQFTPYTTGELSSRLVAMKEEQRQQTADGYYADKEPTPAAICRLAEYITDSIYSIDEEEGDTVQRIAFKGGEYPDAETDMGGLCREAFYHHMIDVLERRPLIS